MENFLIFDFPGNFILNKSWCLEMEKECFWEYWTWRQMYVQSVLKIQTCGFQFWRILGIGIFESVRLKKLEIRALNQIKFFSINYDYCENSSRNAIKSPYLCFFHRFFNWTVSNVSRIFRNQNSHFGFFWNILYTVSHHILTPTYSFNYRW